ncbi:hypothetical protein RB597_003462 [Gaeumannomyces tritici]
MSRHRAYQNYDYDNDLDEYEGDEYGLDTLNPEDQETMNQATVALYNVLGAEASRVPKDQAHEALWHYYFDVDKAAAYLVSKFVAPKPVKAKGKAPEGEPHIFSSVCGCLALSCPCSIAITTPTNQVRAEEAGIPGCFAPGESLFEDYRSGTSWAQAGLESGSMATAAPPAPLSFGNFFHDMPWLNIPKDRQAVFIPPQLARGGLLGGAGTGQKMSKLQALAAARKKAAESKKAGTGDAQVPQQQMGNLSLGEADLTKENCNPALGAMERLRIAASITKATAPSPVPPAPSSPPDPPLQGPGFGQVDEPPTVGDMDMPLPVVSQPSAFARTLLGPPATSRAVTQQQSFALPYMAFMSTVVDAFSQPSPDDTVLAAQAQAGKQKAAGTSKKAPKSEKTDPLSESVKSLKVEDAPLPKSKNLDVLDEYEKSKKKKSASFVVVGHVDAGKSTLMGRLLLDLKVVDERTVQKYRKEAESMGKSSFALAWILDQRTEERSRGVTIDIATNRFETDATSFTILDAPGHKDFIPNMIAGASQADFAILVIDSSTGAFESGLKGQTREHSLLIRSMGVSRVIVAVNKLDTTDWSRDRYDEICQQVSGFMSATGFQMKNVSFVPLSGLNGDNLVKRSTAVAASWYTGPTLIEELESSEPMTRTLKEPLRMTISDVYRTALSPLTITGRLDAGSVQTGDAILVQPSGEKAFVKALEIDSESIDWAVAGQNVTIHLANIDPIHVRTGDIICSTASPIECVDVFTAKILAFDILMPMQVDVHRGRLHAAGQIQEMSAILHKMTGAVTKKKPRIIKAGDTARIVVKMTSKVPLETGQRIILRSNGSTVAAGLLE